MASEKVAINGGMICSCGTDRDDKMALADDLIIEAQDLLFGQGSPDRDKWISVIYQQVTFRFEGEITISSDMWFGISIDTARHDIYLTCDRVEHGLAKAFLLLMEVADEYEEDES